MQAVILAGGRGTWLAERLNGRPKPLIDVCGVPLLDRQLDTLVAHGVTSVVILVNHAADQIIDFVSKRTGGPQIRIVDDGEPRGTAGALLACLDDLEETFLVVYGDTLFDIDIGHMVESHRAASADVTLLVHPNDHPADSDLVEIDECGAILAFHGYRHPQGSELGNLVNAAFYVCQKSALTPWRETASPLDFAKDIFPRMLASGQRLMGYASFEYIKDLGTPSRLDEVAQHLQSGRVERSSRRHRQAAVFLDRDGTLNALTPGDYIREPAALDLLAGVGAAVRRLNDAEFRVVVVTNQPVLARGECSLKTMRRIHRRLETLLGRDGAWLDGLILCPHHPDEGFEGERPELKIACDCRKPKPGMFLEAVARFNIDLDRSWMIGDSTADIAAANGLDLPSILVRTGEAGRDGKFAATPTFLEDTLNDAVHRILSDQRAIA